MTAAGGAPGKHPTLTLDALRDAVGRDAAIRRVQRLQSVGGPGDKVFPPTYPGDKVKGAGKKPPPRHIFETRRLNGQDVRCVLIDSVQSQANRLEGALLIAVGEGRITVPYVAVDFTGQVADGTDVSDLGQITSLDAPHRIFDAIIRDSRLDDQNFTDTAEYKELLKAKPTNSLPVFKLSPTSLVFGVWNSTGDGGGLGAKFTRCVVSEIVGVGAVEGQRGAVRIDPLGIRSSARVKGGPLDWQPASDREKGSVAPSEINHSNIISSVAPGGTAIDHAVQTTVISCAGLRRLQFPGIVDQAAGHAALAALALVAITEADRAGYALRSRCDLVCEGRAAFEIVHPDGESESISLDADAAGALLTDAVRAAREAGFPWSEVPIRLVPQPKLLALVALSRAKALQGESEVEDAAEA